MFTQAKDGSYWCMLCGSWASNLEAGSGTHIAGKQHQANLWRFEHQEWQKDWWKAMPPSPVPEDDEDNKGKGKDGRDGAPGMDGRDGKKGDKGERGWFIC